MLKLGSCFLCSVTGSFLLSFPAYAQPGMVVEHIVIHHHDVSQTMIPAVGGRLSLTLRHNPATLDVINQKTIKTYGYAHVEEASDSAPGVTSGGSPGNPAQIMMRGFTGSQILMLRDGIYYGPTTIVNRPMNTFNLEDIQILKGPSSVLYGQGAVGGTVDVRSRTPALDDRVHVNTLVSYGSFNTWNAGLGGSIPLTSTLALRADFSRTSSDGYVKGADPHSNDLTLALRWKPSQVFSARLGLDYLTDRLSTYFGAPLVPLDRTGDAASGLLRSRQGWGLTNKALWHYYNVPDAHAGSTNVLSTLHMDWQATPHLSLHNRSSFLYADRKWNNAESYTYITDQQQIDAANHPIPSGQIGRDRFYVFQNQHQVGDTLYANWKTTFLGLNNSFVMGGDAYYIRFIRNRGFPDADYADAVPYDAPSGGTVGPFPGELPYRKSPTTLVDGAVFMEDVLTLRDNLRLVGGYRYDWLFLDRQNYGKNGAFNTATSFIRHYNPHNFRIGPVFDLTPSISLYGTLTTAEDPPGANLFLANRNQFTGLSRTRQEEIGVKGSFWQDRAASNLAFYDIRRNQILVATGPDTVANGGAQISRGLEWDGRIRLGHDVALSANVAYTFSRYRHFHPFASNHQVPDVPAVTSNVWGIWSHVAGLPADMGLGMRYVSSRKGDYANNVTLNPYAVANLFVAWHIPKSVTVYGRVDNLTDRHFIQWMDVNYPGQVFLGAPRSFSLSAQADF